MEYHSEFEVVETINSSITKKRHQYSHFYGVQLVDDPVELYVCDLRTNHSVVRRDPKATNLLENKLELAYALYTEIRIHPLHLFFFNDIPRDMWEGFLCGRNHKVKPCQQFDWYDLLYPLPFYPNLQGFCHTKEIVGSCGIEDVRRSDLDEVSRFSLEWTVASLERYSEIIPPHEKERYGCDLQRIQTRIRNLVDLAKERPDSRHLLAELDALEGQERTLERKVRELEALIQRCGPVDYSELEKYCSAIVDDEQNIRQTDLEKRREILQTFVKGFTVHKIKKEINVICYGIPMLPMVRNMVLNEQEQEISSTIELPEYNVVIAYKKRRLELPKQYRSVIQVPEIESPAFKDAPLIVEKQDALSVPQKVLQLKLF